MELKCTDLLFFGLCFTIGTGFLLPEENIVVPGRSASRMTNSRADEIAKLLKELKARKEKRIRTTESLVPRYSQCRVEGQQLLACGNQAVDEDQCIRRGCCWRETTEPGVPWCFHSASTSRGACVVDERSRMDCGLFGLSAGLCKKAGCCWNPSLTENVPWCFFPQGAGIP